VPAENPSEHALESAVRRALRERVQAESLNRLRGLGLPELRLPWIAGGVDSPAALARLAACF
jgi:hypothetical protein